MHSNTFANKPACVPSANSFQNWRRSRILLVDFIWNETTCHSGLIQVVGRSRSVLALTYVIIRIYDIMIVILGWHTNASFTERNISCN